MQDSSSYILKVLQTKFQTLCFFKVHHIASILEGGEEFSVSVVSIIITMFC